MVALGVLRRTCCGLRVDNSRSSDTTTTAFSGLRRRLQIFNLVVLSSHTHFCCSRKFNPPYSFFRDVPSSAVAIAANPPILGSWTAGCTLLFPIAMNSICSRSYVAAKRNMACRWLAVHPRHSHLLRSSVHRATQACPSDSRLART